MITGAARRVGLACAHALARAGHDLVLTYHTSVADAEAARAELAAASAAVRLERLDLNDLDATDAAARRLAADLPRLDVLVHNASSYDQTPLETLTPDDLLRAYRVNAAAPLLLSRGLSPLLRDRRGSIVALADIHALGEHGLPRRENYAAYAMSKSALVEMVRTLARELAPHVRVNAVAFGVAAWPEAGGESAPELQERYLRSVPMARAGTPTEAAEVVRFLAAEAGYVTGQILRMDGGRSLV